MKPTALYRFYSPSDELLYVGITHRIESRFSDHKRSKPWEKVGRIAVEHHPTREAAIAAETAAIKSEGPKWNVKHNGGPQPQQKATDDMADTHPLVDMYFHGIERHDDGCRYVKTQGFIHSHLGPVNGEPAFLVCFYSWLTGGPSTMEVRRLSEMPEWRFYDDPEWWNAEYRHGLRHMNEKHENGLCGVTV